MASRGQHRSLGFPEAPEGEIPGGTPDRQVEEQELHTTAEEKLISTQNGGMGKKKPEPLFIPRGSDKDSIYDLTDLKRQSSRSSLVSTFSQGVKEKLSGAIPNNLTKNTDINKLRLVVFILFAACFSIVVATNIVYRQHKGEVRIFDRVRLEEHHRNLLLYDTDNRLVMQGHLGSVMSPSLHPYTCLPGHNINRNIKCLEWKDLARLEISQIPSHGASCHRLHWTSLTKDITLRDCWPLGPGHGHWYGGGERLTANESSSSASSFQDTAWPLGSNTEVDLVPFVTGDENQTEWGNVIKKFFINSRGLSITIADDSPLYVSINDPKITNGNHGLCLQASFDEFPYYYHRFKLPVLNYTVCTAPTLAQVYASNLDDTFWEGHTDTDIKLLDDLLQLPLWEVPVLGMDQTYTPDGIDSYVKNLLGSGTVGRVDRGYLLLDYHWQKNMGDFHFSPNHFPHVKEVSDKVKEAGLKLALTISPFISVESTSFKEGVTKGLFVMERNSSSPHGTPALTWFQDTAVVALLDITNNDTIAWLRGKLRSLLASVGREAVFVLQTGNTFHTPHYYSFKSPLHNPDLYKEHFIREAMEEVPVVGVSGASSKRPKAPAFVWLSPLSSSWSSLQSIIPNILHLGVIGYPFINPGPVGGLPSNFSILPEPELYKRWWQLATFLPQLHFLTPPSNYINDTIAAVATPLKDIRKNLVIPLLKSLRRESLQSGLPLVRPLWMIAPDDEVSQRVSDQFMLGDSLLVAPILEQGHTQRNVYLPPSRTGLGVWRRKDGTFFQGGQWLNKSQVPLDEILYFKKLPDTVRPGDPVSKDNDE